MKKFIALLLATATLGAEPQAVVFDFGGVMTNEPNRTAVIEFLCQSFELTQSEFEAASEEKRKAIKAGKTDIEFWVEYAHTNGIELPMDWELQFKTTMKNALGINPEMYLLVEQIKEKEIPVGLLSNIDERRSKIIKDFELYKPFDPCLLSCDIGVEKPDIRAYQIMLREFDLPAADVVFVDDKIENVESAQTLGIDAILYRSAEQIREELVKRKLL
jgi:epoxide hydrolase-like predicted phosphatase